jgi:hypothetical protein
MGDPLNKDSLMECVRHGIRRPAFICQHLRLGEGIGFNQDHGPFDPEWPFQNAWCAECDKVLLREGEWNDVSERFAKVTLICEGCLEEIRSRNQPSGPDANS